MDKKGILGVIVIVAAVGIGAAVLVATSPTQQETTTAETGTLEGMEMEQSGEAIPGEQSTDESSNAVGTNPPNEATEQPGSSGSDTSVSQSGNVTTGGSNDTSSTGGTMGDASGLDSSGAPPSGSAP